MPEAATEHVQVGNELQHYALGVYTMGNSKVEVSVVSGEQTRANLNVGINSGASESRNEEDSVGEGARADGWTRRYHF
jgi:hypothetical protein